MFKYIRLFFLKTHLWVGLLLALPLILMSVTGAILAFEPQIVKWAQVQYFKDKHAQNKPLNDSTIKRAFSIDSLLQMQNKVPQEIQIFADFNQPILVKYSPKQSVWIHALTGENLGEGPTQIQDFFEFVEHLHRWLALEGKWRELGKWSSGIVSLALLFLALSGLVLWMPFTRKLWKWSWIKSRVKIYKIWPKSIQSQDLKALRAPHMSVGFWALPLILIVSLSGAIISFHPAQNVLVGLFATKKSEFLEKPKKRPGLDNEVRVFPTSLEKIVNHAQSQSTVWTSIRVVLAPEHKNLQVFVVQTSEDKIKAPLQLEYTPHSEFKSIKKTAQAQQIKMWNKYTHNGQIFGIYSQIIAFIASLAILFLSITGLILGVFKVTRKKYA